MHGRKLCINERRKQGIQTMRAVELRTYGDPASGIHVVDLPEPDAPGHGEILVGVEYAPVNLHDILVLQGYFPFHPELPSPVGNEGIGRVLAAGSGVSNVTVGDLVVLPLFSMTWREKLLLPASSVFLVPDAGDIQQFSMLRGNPVTAALLLSEYKDLKPGDWIIQNAGNSSVARTVVAIAKSRGLKTINMVRRLDVIDDVIAAGADASFLDDEASLQQIKDLVGLQGIGLAIDGVGGKAVGRLTAALSPGGVVVSYGTVGGDFVASLSMVDVIFKDITYRGFYVDRSEYDASLPQIISEAATLIASGNLSVPVAGVYAIDDILAAIAHVQRGGKVLLKLRS
jgi:NADPH:quinone reductase-like Zn-dependent oxidoreductase